MKFTAILACLIVALDCAEKAVGWEAQTLFQTQHLWVWWLAAFGWIVAAFAQGVRE